MIGIIDRHQGNKCQPARAVASKPLFFFCPATLLATHQLGMTSEPLANCQSSNRHFRRILDQRHSLHRGAGTSHTDLCFFLELWLPSQYSESSVTFVNHTFSQPSGKQEMGGISLESSGNTRKTPSEPHFNGRLYLLAKSFNGVCSKEKGSTGSEFHSFWITRYSYQKLWFPKNRV